jgi:hypothetical protein
MGSAEGIVFTLGPTGEAGETTRLSQGPDPVAAAGQYFVRIGLMAHIPDQSVVWCVENGVNRDGQLDHAEGGAKMAAGDGDGVDHLGSKFLGDLSELFPRKVTQIGWDMNAVEQRGMRGHGQF